MYYVVNNTVKWNSRVQCVCMFLGLCNSFLDWLYKKMYTHNMSTSNCEMNNIIMMNNKYIASHNITR